MARRFVTGLLIGLASSGYVGCRATRQRVRDPDYAPLATAQLYPRPGEVVQAQAVNPIDESLAGPHPLDDFLRVALAQNPRLQAARKMLDAREAKIPQARSLEDPMLSSMGYPSIPYAMQTSGGRMTAAMTLSQKLPWVGTLSTQEAAASANADAAAAEFAAIERETALKVKRAYYELFYAQAAVRITEQERASLATIARVADFRYRAGAVSQQDVLRSQLELADLERELLRMRQELASAQGALARLVHRSPSTPVATLDELPTRDVPRDLERLYEQAIASRPELHASLAAVARQRHEVELAQLKYYPDLTVSVGWQGMATHAALAPTADGKENWLMGLMVNVPIYRQRLDAAVREAEAMVVTEARQYDDLRDETLEMIRDLFAQANSQRDMLTLFREKLRPTATETLAASHKAYEVGEVDFMQLLDNWRQVLRVQLAEQRVETQLLQSLAALERLVGDLPACYEVPAPLPYSENDACLSPSAAEIIDRATLDSGAAPASN